LGSAIVELLKVTAKFMKMLYTSCAAHCMTIIASQN
jgi:hypothetical protein